MVFFLITNFNFVVRQRHVSKIFFECPKVLLLSPPTVGGEQEMRRVLSLKPPDLVDLLLDL